jgi:hypothetical protein
MPQSAAQFQDASYPFGPFVTSTPSCMVGEQIKVAVFPTMFLRYWLPSPCTSWLENAASRLARLGLASATSFLKIGCVFRDR